MTASVQHIRVDPARPAREAVAAVVAVLRSGGVAVAPTDTTYGLLADAENLQAFQRVFELKGRPADAPMPYLLADKAQAEAFLARSLARAAAAAADAFWPGALTLVVEAGEAVARHLVAPDGTIGLRVPDSGFVRAVAEGVGGPLTGTSANRTGEPPATTAAEADAAFGAAVDCIVEGGLAAGRPSSVVDTTRTPWRMLRQGPVTAAQLSSAAGVAIAEER